MPARDLLVEIGTEELPPKSLNRLRHTFAEGCKAGLSDAQLGFSELTSYASPRRIAIIVTALEDRQPDQTIERRGPAVKAAYDEAGEPTKALTGFMGSCGITDDSELTRIKTDKGDYLVYQADKTGESLGDLLPGILAKALADLPIDRRMRWGSRRNEFVRPVHWVVCLHGNVVLPIEVLGKTAGNTSRGHRFMSDGNFTISDAASYVESCRAQFVMVDFEERKGLIRTQIEALAASESGELEEDDALLEEVTSLVEWPVALAGKFDDEFLAVPPEVLISAMKEHQRYFHLTDPKTGSLLPRFITISNIESNNPDLVVGGNERVIRPRLADAKFFFDQDTKTSLEANATRLGKVVFQTDLGSYAEKASRIADLAGYLAGETGLNESAASRAGALCKADLVSDMVIEFPDLQGTMGGYYATNDGESDEVSKGITQHYRPAFAGDELPERGAASCVSLADKLDTLVGLFGIDQPPTGSKDPFALRRQSLGIIRICVENELDFSLSAALHKAASIYNRDFNTATAERYVIERLANYYGEQQITSDVVDAAVSAAGEEINLHRLHRIILSIMKFRRTEVAESIIAANKRVANLLKKNHSQLPEYNVDLASDDAEKSLFEALTSTDLATCDSFDEGLERLAGLQKPIDQFFDDVLVMDEDETVRANRLSLLNNLQQQFLEVADFSLLQ